MINPAELMKVMGAKKKFERNHPKVFACLTKMFSGGLSEGTIVELTVQKPDGEKLTTNLRVLKEDLKLLEDLKKMSK